jgi:hypothetical protein
MVIFNHNLKTKQMEKPKEKPKCQHIQTYIAVRHLSGISLVKCSECGQAI